ncbi:MAG TPA: hypothetical protein VGQ52_00085 [Gemmatimonadaceae bacterium]|nr:hypothetical protein [Gemmatimonadaceae bacterium]
MVMFFFFIALLFGLVITPVVIFTIMRVVPRVVDRTVPPIVDRIASAALSPELDARLNRIEEAIDAMATEIDRMKTAQLDAYQEPQRLGAPRIGEQEPGAP